MSNMAGSWEIVNALGAAIGAVGTVSAVAVALGIAIRDGRAIRAERNDQLAAQARSVVSSVPTPEVVTISNHSKEPILAAQITTLTAILQRPDGATDQYGGGADPDLNGVIAPGNTWETSIWLVSIDGNNLMRPTPTDSWHVSVTFRVLDSDGWWWQRVDNNAPPESSTEVPRWPVLWAVSVPLATMRRWRPS
ncbi:hypothetical protein [Nocardia sp. NPDC019395]|uniref:hypothetical protein n=1 Tax=Nocardia sp. NPDC019395 TaxID=3154686 RepID=UPI0034040CB5